MSTMFGGGGGASPASWGMTSDILKKNQTEQDRLTEEGKTVQAMADLTGTSASALAANAEQRRLLGISNPNPLMTTGYSGVANYGGNSRTLGSPYMLGT